MDIVGTDKAPGHLLRGKINAGRATVGIMGLGYVGLPLALAAARSGYAVVGFDTDAKKIRRLAAGDSYIDAVNSAELQSTVAEGRMAATADMRRLSDCDVICICVPTPLTKQREPDLSYVRATAQAIARSIRRGQLIILESTTYPGTTEDVVRPILEKSGLSAGADFFIGYSPEREDPGNGAFNTASIPKVVSGLGAEAAELVTAFYGRMVETTVPVSSVRTAEVVKLTENIFRAVNIGLVNELKLIYDAMGIDIWEVIGAAKTKPFGYMPFYPGPGLGGHCIPVDPFYLTWKSREYSIPTRFIELAGEVNAAMPQYVVARLAKELDVKLSLAMSRSSILVVGIAYKKGVNDVRESPAMKILELLQGQVADLAYHDPHVPLIETSRHHPQLVRMKSITLTSDSIAAYDAVLIATDHDKIDYGLIERHARLIVDTRNAMRTRGIQSEKVVLA